MHPLYLTELKRKNNIVVYLFSFERERLNGFFNLSFISASVRLCSLNSIKIKIMVIYCFTVFLIPVEQVTINRSDNWLITQADASANTGNFYFFHLTHKIFISNSVNHS